MICRERTVNENENENKNKRQQLKIIMKQTHKENATLKLMQILCLQENINIEIY